MANYLERYLAGEWVEVWDELYQLGPAIRADAALWQAAQQIAQVTMERARFNVELLVTRLKAQGYRFVFPKTIYAPPPASIEAELAEIEATVGAIPLALRTWLAVVGNVNLMGYLPDARRQRHPAWDQKYAADPLVVEYELDHFWSSHDDWTWNQEADGTTEPFGLEFAPDDLHKDNVSGGSPYSIALPNLAIDAPILDQWHDLTFVAYLRESFHWGGFLGLSRLPNPPLELIEDLRAGMLPI